jgi:hypothetical protein
MPTISFGEWTPDQPAGDGSAIVKNVMPRTDKSYSPFPTPAPYSQAVPGRVQGAYAIFDSQRQNFTFAATDTSIYLMQTGASATWAEVSKTAGGYTTLPFSQGGMWSSTSFGNLVIFTNFNDPVQSYLINSSTAFADLAADAPHAYYCAIIKDFLFLGNTHDLIDLDQPRRVWWSSIGDPHDWPSPGSDLAIMRQSDFQDLEQSDLGHVHAIIGGNLTGADGAVILERGVVRVTYAGSPSIFDFHIAEGSSGTTSPWSVVTRRMPTPAGYRSVAYYLGEGGFVAFDGQSAAPIGAGKFDRTVIADMEPARRFQTLGISSPNFELVIWAYIGRGGGQGSDLYNRLLVYNWAIGRAAICEITPIEFIGYSLMSNLSLDDLDPFGDLETLPYSLDSPLWQTDVPTTGLFDNQHRLCYMTGPSMAATVETGEAGLDGRRSKLHGTARPVVEGSGGNQASIAVGRRDRKMDAVTYAALVPVNVLGTCPMRSTGRYVRLQITIPAAAQWDHLRGIELEPRPEGRIR